MRVEELQVGQKLRGVVQSIRSFGCFVDVGADRDGLVHISRMSSGFVQSIDDLVRPGQEVLVWVSEVAEGGRLGLSMVETAARGRQPDLAAFKGTPSSQWFAGTVASITDYGIFVELEPPGGGPPARGLVHVTQIRDGFVSHPADEAQAGQGVRVRVINVDTFSGRLGLSMKEADGAAAGGWGLQDVRGFADVSRLEWFRGSVHHTTTFGVFVELAPPGGGPAVKGLVHSTQIRQGFSEDPASEVAVGEEVRVRVLDVDVVAGKLSLTMREPTAES